MKTKLTPHVPSSNTVTKMCKCKLKFHNLVIKCRICAVDSYKYFKIIEIIVYIHVILKNVLDREPIVTKQQSTDGSILPKKFKLKD